jgi:ureidoglycolate lyase
MTRVNIPIQPLTRQAFTPYGDVIQVAEASHRTINQGWAERYVDLARLDVLEKSGKPTIGIVRAEPRPIPLRIRIMERHPLASQAFVPLAPRAFLVVVAAPGDAPKAGQLAAFRTNAGQGVNYARGVWHHPLIALDQAMDFLVIDRQGEGPNYDEALYDSEDIWVG